MTTRKKEPREGGGEEASVVAYLRAHPWFFVEHAELLADLVVPHVTGDAVSLVERQVSVMREKYRRLLNKHQELLTIARDNEGLEHRLYQLASKLAEAGDLREVLDRLYEDLCNGFKADGVAVRLFAEPRRAKHRGLPEFAGKHWLHRALFEEVTKSGQPFCGRLEPAQQTALFEGTGDRFGSAVVAPLSGRAWQGVLAVASRDPHRYYQGMGLDFMAHLGVLVSLSLQPWVTA